jgi:uncharacterized protein YqeY
MLPEKLNTDIIRAQKGKDEITLNCLRMLKSSIKYAAIQKCKQSLEDAEIIEVIQKQIKQRKDSIAAFQQGNRPDLAQKEEREMSILSAYLPAELSAEELKKIIAETVAKTQAKSKADKGRLMKEVMAQVRGRADGSRISELVDQLLSS